MAYYEETLENIKIKKICSGCVWLTTYLSCEKEKERYRDYVTNSCKFYQPRRELPYQVYYLKNK